MGLAVVSALACTSCRSLPSNTISIDVESLTIKEVRFQGAKLPEGLGPVTFSAVSGTNQVTFSSGQKRFECSLDVRGPADYVIRASPPRIIGSNGEVFQCWERKATP
jgi:hypothetical protein